MNFDDERLPADLTKEQVGRQADLDELYERLLADLPRERVHRHADMRRWSSFAAGGSADLLVQVASGEEIQELLRLSRQNDLPLTFLGRGSNVLVSDKGIRGICLRLGDSFSRIRRQGCRLRVDAGASLAAVCAFAARWGLGGAEFLCGIPGSLGGAVLMNAGAYEHSISEILEESAYLELDGSVGCLPLSEHHFSYRHSAYSRGDKLILGAELRLKQRDAREIYLEMADLQARRRQSQPLELASAGSTFKRPENHFAGKLISDAGLKGYRKGNCGVSCKHAGFVVNYGGATASEILSLVHEVQARVREFSGVNLEPEFRLLGDWS